MKLCYFKPVLTGILIVIGLTAVAQKTEKVYLSGTGAENTKTWDFYCSGGMNSKKWTKIEVPSCWEQQGFGEYNYGHVEFEKRLKETGTYKTSFTAPKSWKGNEVGIVFEGVMTDATVKLNGKLIGSKHQGAFYEFGYDISKYIKYGASNTLEVFVQKFSSNESINQAERKADFWIFGGIYRPVYLEVKPKENIQRVAIDGKADGSFKADVFTSTLKKADEVAVSIQSLDGIEVTSFSSKVLGSTTRVEGKVNSPKLWNQEAPNLYQAVFTLKTKGTVSHQHVERFGFRTVEVRANDGIYVNDVRIKMKGVDRHTFHPKYGRTSSKALSIEAVNLMKEMNMNAVRMSHYPPGKHFLDVCDSIGLFVLDELTGWQTPAYDDEVGKKLVKELIIRDVNHPSIILWDNGNEGGWNYNLDNDFDKYDIQKRTVTHPWQDFRETNTLHYVDYNYLSLDGYSKRKIYFPTEILHGLYDGGHGAGLEDYWFRIWNHPLGAGAFLWVFADEAVSRSDRNGELDADGNHAPDGILGPYMEKEGSFYTIKKIWSPIYFEKRYVTPQFNGVFNIENRYHYTNLSECSFLVEWKDFASIDAKENIVSSEKIKIDLEPGQSGKFKINLPDDWMNSEVLKISATDEKGMEIATWSYPVQSAASTSKELTAKKGENEVSVESGSNDISISVGNMSYAFDKSSGLLKEVKKGNKIIPLSNGPVFVSKEKEVDEVKNRTNSDGSVSVCTIYKNEMDSVVWTVNKNGLLDLSVAYEPKGNSPYAGVSFSFPEEKVSGMKWMGEGPFRVWKNRMQGNDFGVWEKNYNNTITGYSGFEYPEFKGYHAETYWANVKSKDGTGFNVFVKSNDIFLRMLTPEFPEDGRNTIVEFPKGDISFLHGINAIGTKFKKTASQGPQSSTYFYNHRKIAGRKLRMDLVFEF